MSGRWQPGRPFDRDLARQAPQVPVQAAPALQVTIYHNPDCAASCNTLEAIRAAGHEPTIVEYLKVPLRRDEIAALIALAGLSVLEAARTYETEYRALGLQDDQADADRLLDVLTDNPRLLNRPFVTVVQESGEMTAALCRPSEKVARLLQKA